MMFFFTGVYLFSFIKGVWYDIKKKIEQDWKKILMMGSDGNNVGGNDSH